MDLYTQAQIYLLNYKVGEGYNIGLENQVLVVERTSKKVVLSNNITIHIKTNQNGHKYLSSKTVKIKNRNYELLDRVLRDIEGYLVYKIHCFQF